MVFKMDHVEQADMGHDGAKKVRALGQGGPDQEAPVAPTFNRQSRRARIAAIDEELGTGQKVIEDILLASQVSATMPVFSVLAAAAQVGNGDHASPIEPDTAGDTEARRLTD